MLDRVLVSIFKTHAKDPNDENWSAPLNVLSGGFRVGTRLVCHTLLCY